MSGYIGYRDGGKTSEQGLKEELNRLYTAGVASGDTATSLQVAQRAAGANMSVDIAIGDAHLVRPDATYSYWGWTDAVANQAITAADPANPRIDAIVAYLDPSVVSSASNNNPGAFKFSAIAGTPAGSPVAPTNSAIQAALGANFPWIPLAQVAVAANATTIVNANITDVRVAITAKSLAGANTIPATAIQATAIKLGANINTTTAVVTAGAAPAEVTNASVTVPAGGRDLEIIGYIPYISAGGAAIGTIKIWDGAMTSGTQLQAVTQKWQDAGFACPVIIYARVSAPSAGAKTYRLSIECNSANLQYNVGSTSPAILTVKAI